MVASDSLPASEDTSPSLGPAPFEAEQLAWLTAKATARRRAAVHGRSDERHRKRREKQRLTSDAVAAQSRNRQPLARSAYVSLARQRSATATFHQVTQSGPACGVDL